VLHSRAWGLRHTATLFLIRTAAALFGLAITQRMTSGRKRIAAAFRNPCQFIGPLSDRCPVDLNLIENMAHPTGFEPVASAFGGHRNGSF